MNRTVFGLNIHYLQEGTGPDVLLLHGWGASCRTMEPILQTLCDRFTVTAIDLPGFGQSQAPESVWGVEDYARFIETFCGDLGIENPILAGHSFGGQVSICLTGKLGFPVKKLILIDSAGVRRTQKSLKQRCFAFGKKVLSCRIFGGVFDKLLEKIKYRFGSADYKAAKGIMREILVKILAEDVQEYLPNIAAPTLLIWGTADTATPPEHAEKMDRQLKDSGIVWLEGAGHYSYLERAGQFRAVLNSFVTDRGAAR